MEAVEVQRWWAWKSHPFLHDGKSIPLKSPAMRGEPQACGLLSRPRMQRDLGSYITGWWHAAGVGALRVCVSGLGG